MNDDRKHESGWFSLLDGAAGGLDVLGAAGEVLCCVGEAMVTVLSALLDILPGL